MNFTPGNEKKFDTVRQMTVISKRGLYTGLCLRERETRMNV